MLRSINDLPSHVLFVHAPVVLVPLIALAALAMAVRPRWRVRYGPHLAVASLVALIATFLAKESGEEFDDLLDGSVDVARHQSLADQTFYMLIGLVVLLASVAFLDLRNRRSDTDARGTDGDDSKSTMASLTRGKATLPTGIMAAGTVLALVATTWMIRTGDEGASLVWDGTVARADAE